ncbi:unnamed protein product [Medioppia subpectinata]|uniref:BTB domain-containing protein n=1 Tax=Medioppia subpectinata TaxID=1979941 RepID=A0A7R9LBM5_9ACAR|nr:unnamed protein product [Medioppia subpectinata]CAG2117153.1 unnamed protein product [Medioppia subpectinata]
MLRVLIIALCICFGYSYDNYQHGRRSDPYNYQNDGPRVSDNYIDGQHQRPDVVVFPGFGDHYLNDSYSDVKLGLNGTKLPAHKLVLLTESQYFAKLFGEDPTKQEFDLQDMVSSEDTFKVMLKYLYTKRTEFNAETPLQTVFDVYLMAKKFGVERLMRDSEVEITKMITIGNYLAIYKFADEHQLHDLKRFWMSFVFENSKLIIEQTNSTYMNESLDVSKHVLMALKATPSFVIAKIKQLRETHPNVSFDDFKNIMFIQRCTVDDINALFEMNLFDNKYLFDILYKKYKHLERNPKCPPCMLSPHYMPQTPLRLNQGNSYMISDGKVNAPINANNSN